MASVWWGNCVCEAVVVQSWSLSTWTERASLGSCKWVIHCIPLVCGWWSAYAAVNSVLPRLHNSFLPLCFRCKSSMIRNTSRSCSALPASPMTTPTPRTPTRRVLWCAMPPGTLLPQTQPARKSSLHLAVLFSQSQGTPGDPCERIEAAFWFFSICQGCIWSYLKEARPCLFSFPRSSFWVLFFFSSSLLFFFFFLLLPSLCFSLLTEHFQFIKAYGAIVSL